MKKLLLIASLLALSGCDFLKSTVGQPTRAVGECFTDEPGNLEAWEKDDRYVHRVIGIGNTKYRLLTTNMDGRLFLGTPTVFETSRSFGSAVYKKITVECPQSLQLELINGK